MSEDQIKYSNTKKYITHSHVKTHNSNWLKRRLVWV